MTAKYNWGDWELTDFNHIIQIFTESQEKMGTDELETIKWMVRYGRDITVDSLKRLISFLTIGRYDNFEYEEHKLAILEHIVERFAHDTPTEDSLESIKKISDYLGNNKKTSCSPQSYARLYFCLAQYYLSVAE